MPDEVLDAARRRGLAAALLGCLGAVALTAALVGVHACLRMLTSWSIHIGVGFAAAMSVAWFKAEWLVPKRDRALAFVGRGCGLALLALLSGALAGGLIVLVFEPRAAQKGGEILLGTVSWLTAVGALPACAIGALTGLVLRRERVVREWLAGE